MKSETLRLYRHELSVCFKGVCFRIALVIALLLAMTAAGEAFCKQFFNHSVDSFYLSNLSAWANWIVSDAGLGTVAYVFRMIIPLLAAFPFAWSYNAERASGYEVQILVRCSRRDRILAKMFATFCSGAIITSVVCITNIIVLLALLPARIPFYEDWMILGVFYDSLFSYWFYNAPFMFVVLYTMLDMLLMGVWAVFVLCCSVVLRNRISVLVVPFLALHAWHYINVQLPISLDMQLPSFNLIDDLDPTFYLLKSTFPAIALQLIVLSLAIVVSARLLMSSDAL